MTTGILISLLILLLLAPTDVWVWRRTRQMHRRLNWDDVERGLLVFLMLLLMMLGVRRCTREFGPAPAPVPEPAPVEVMEIDIPELVFTEVIPVPVDTVVVEPEPEPEPRILEKVEKIPAKIDTTALVSMPEEIYEMERPVLWLPIYHWSPRTNLLLPGLNVGVEYTFGEKGHFSLAADLYYPWIWPPKSGRWCFELMFANVEARWTFRDGTYPSRRGTGPSIGLFAMAGHYDFGREFRGRQGEFVATGLDFRWTWSIWDGCGRLGVGLGVGYMNTVSRDYVVYTVGGELYRTGEWSNRMDYWGPVKADVTLSIPLWHSYNKKR